MMGGSPVLHTVARIATPITILGSFVVFLQGHNLPGGGFIAGIMITVAGIIFMLAFGLKHIVWFPWWKLSVLGLLCAVTTGTIPMFWGFPYMEHSVWFFDLPIIGQYELPTATFFDLGVYLIVLGTLMTIFVELAKEED